MKLQKRVCVVVALARDIVDPYSAQAIAAAAIVSIQETIGLGAKVFVSTRTGSHSSDLD